MTPVDPRQLSGRADEMRRTFDATFAEPPPSPPGSMEAFLVVMAGGERIAVRRSDLTGFAPGDDVTPTPGNSAHFLGLAGVRGEIYPVWSLAGLEGRHSSKTAPVSWLLLTTGPGGAPCALACERFEKIVFSPKTAAEGRITIPFEDALIPVIDVPALHAAILNQKEPSHPRRTTP